MFNTIRIIHKSKPVYLSGKEIKVNLNNTVEINGVVYEYDSNTSPNYTRGGKCN